MRLLTDKDFDIMFNDQFNPKLIKLIVEDRNRLYNLIGFGYPHKNLTVNLSFIQVSNLPNSQMLNLETTLD